VYEITVHLLRAVCCVCDVLQEDIKTLITYLVEKHFSAFEGVTYVQTFKALRQRYDQRAERSVMADRSPVNLVETARSLWPCHCQTTHTGCPLVLESHGILEDHGKQQKSWKVIVGKECAPWVYSVKGSACQVPLSSNLAQSIHAYVPPSLSSIIWYWSVRAVIDNCRPGARFSKKNLRKNLG